MNLHPYQRRARAETAAALKAGHRRIVLVSPTGSGKTVVLGSMTRDVVARGKRACWFVNRRELVHQTARTLERFGLQVGHSGANLAAPVQIRTYQGALAAGEVPPFDVGFADECHHLAGHGDWLSALQACPDATVIGATATPERGDGAALDYFQHLIPVAQPADLVDLWHKSGGRMGLVPCHVERPGRPLDGMARTPAKATVLHKLRDHQQVVFAGHVAAAEEFVRQFREIGLSVALVTGETPKDDRDTIVRDFAERRTRVLVNCQVFTEGTDLPAIDVVTIARKVSSVGAMIQMTGRGARPAPDKTRFVVLDLFGVTHVLGHPFEDRAYSLTGRGISGCKEDLVRVSLCKRCGAEMPEEGNACLRCDWTRPALEIPKELNEKLERWEWRRTQTTDDRVRRMTDWIRRHRGNPKAVAIAIHMYRGYYHEKDCPRDVIAHAVANIAGRPWCDRCRHSVRDDRCKCPLTDEVAPGIG